MERMWEGLKAARSNEPPRSVHALVSKPRLLFLQELPAWVNHGSKRTETAVTTFTAKRRKRTVQRNWFISENSEHATTGRVSWTRESLVYTTWRVYGHLYIYLR